MANPAWPGTLPLPQRSGYALEPGEAVARTDMEAGAPRQRRRFTVQAPTRVPVRWRMSSTEFPVFEEFVENDLAAGSAWCDMTLLMATGLQTVEARFVGMWRASPIGPVSWLVEAVLEVRTRPIAA